MCVKSCDVRLIRVGVTHTVYKMCQCIAIVGVGDKFADRVGYLRWWWCLTLHRSQMQDVCVKSCDETNPSRGNTHLQDVSIYSGGGSGEVMNSLTVTRWVTLRWGWCRTLHQSEMQDVCVKGCDETDPSWGYRHLHDVSIYSCGGSREVMKSLTVTRWVTLRCGDVDRVRQCISLT